jgi:plastocyanin
MKRISTGIVVLAIALIPLAGCGGDDSPTASAAPAADAGGTAVQMLDNAFEARDIAVSVGEQVTWTNEGALPHTVTATEGEDFDSKTVAPGESFTWTAEQPGQVTYVCTFHPGMEGTITVR